MNEEDDLVERLWKEYPSTADDLLLFLHVKPDTREGLLLAAVYRWMMERGPIY